MYRDRNTGKIPPFTNINKLTAAGIMHGYDILAAEESGHWLKSWYLTFTAPIYIAFIYFSSRMERVDDLPTY